MKTVLITGATSGIGLELAKIFAAEGYRLVVVARSTDKLMSLKGIFQEKHRIDVLPFTMDLSKDGSADRLFRNIEDAQISIDVLVNNAGFGWRGFFAEMPAETMNEMMELNVASLVRLTRAFLPGMIQRCSGKILNVASTAAFQPGPWMATYYASKAFVLFFSEALHEELQGTGVTVTALCPGATRTEFQSRAGVANTHLFRGPFVMDAGVVAKVGFDGLMAGKAVVIPGVKNKIMVFAERFGSRALIRKIVRRIHTTPS